MSSFKRIAISNRSMCSRTLPEQILRLGNQIDSFILREKDLQEGPYEKLAFLVQRACREVNTELICHTFVSAARRISCSAIHLPLPLLSKWQGQLEDFSCIGASIHSLQEAQIAEAAGANYIIAGNIYETDCKAGLAGKGPGFLQEICMSVSIPVYAIGGVTEGREPELKAAGAAGACRMSDYMKK